MTAFIFYLLIILLLSVVFQSGGSSANMFYTCGPNEAMVVSGENLATSTFFYLQNQNQETIIVAFY